MNAMNTAYVLTFIALAICFILKKLIGRKEKEGDKYLVYYISTNGNICYSRIRNSGCKDLVYYLSTNGLEVAVPFAIVGAIYSFASLALMAWIESDQTTIDVLWNLQISLQALREYIDIFKITKWWNAAIILLLLLFSLIRLPQEIVRRHSFLRYLHPVTSVIVDILARYRKLHKRMLVTLICLASFTFFPGVDGGDLAQLASARLETAKKQLALLGAKREKAVANDLARLIVKRSIDTFPNDYLSAITYLPTLTLPNDYLSTPTCQQPLYPLIRTAKDQYKLSLPLQWAIVERLVARYGRTSQEHPPSRTETPSPDISTDELFEAAKSSDSRVSFSSLAEAESALKEYEDRQFPGSISKKPSTFEQPQTSLQKKMEDAVVNALLSPKLLTERVAVITKLSDQYPLLEPLIDVIADSVNKVIAGFIHEKVKKELAAFTVHNEDSQDELIRSIKERAEELAHLAVTDFAAIGQQGKIIMYATIADEKARLRVLKETDAAVAEARQKLVDQNKKRLDWILRTGRFKALSQQRLNYYRSNLEDRISYRSNLENRINNIKDTVDPFEQSKKIDQFDALIDNMPQLTNLRRRIVEDFLIDRVLLTHRWSGAKKKIDDIEAMDDPYKQKEELSRFEDTLNNPDRRQLEEYLTEHVRIRPGFIIERGGVSPTRSVRDSILKKHPKPGPMLHPAR